MFFAWWRTRPRATASIAGGARQHADLHRADIEIGEHRVDLRGDEIGRHVEDGGDFLGVLRGQRGDDGGAIDAERGEGLEIGLDAGAAARIRAGDGDGDRGHARPRCASARVDHRAQLLRGKRRIARQRERRDHRDAVGAGRDHVGRVAGIDAGDGADRKPGFARAHRLHDGAQSGDADRRRGIVLGGRAIDAADRHVVEQFERRRFGLLHRLDAEPDDGGAAEQQPRVGRRACRPGRYARRRLRRRARRRRGR